MPSFRAGWFHRTFSDLLDEFLSAVIAKKSTWLIIQAPRQHGKSELVSRRFPAISWASIPSYASLRPAAIDMLAQRISGINRVNPAKYDRAFAASGELNTVNCHLPHLQVASWVNEFLFELSSFPRRVDAWSQAAGELNTGVNYDMFTESGRVCRAAAGLSLRVVIRAWVRLHAMRVLRPTL
jgi:hypothetical protein